MQQKSHLKRRERAEGGGASDNRIHEKRGWGGRGQAQITEYRRQKGGGERLKGSDSAEYIRKATQVFLHINKIT